MDEVAFGRYRLIELIGEGGMGQVFRANDTVIGREVAIKVLPPEMAGLPGYRERFRREAQIAARLTEPHIVPIHDTGEIDGRLYLVMPVIEGVDVQTLLARQGPMDPARAVRVIQQLAAALSVAHRNRLVHRDVKPSNALLTADEHVYLIDFGIAHDASATRMTQTGMMVGTFAYMAPERFLAGSVDARADVYALACVLHECLTGARPFPGDSMEQQIAGHLTMDPPKPSKLNPAVPSALDHVIARGMAKQPNERYQTAGELAAAAHDAISGSPPTPRPPAPPAPPSPVRPVAPTMPGTQQHANLPTQQAVTLVAPAESRPTIGASRLGCALAGVALLSLAATYLLVPWRSGSWQLIRYLVPSVLMWLSFLGLIPGLVLLAKGRGRAFPDRTIVGTALVTTGVGTALCRVLFPGDLVAVSAGLGVIGSVLLVGALFPAPTRSLARAYVMCGSAVLALGFFDLAEAPLKGVNLHAMALFSGVAMGLVVTTAGGLASQWLRRQAPQRPAERAPATGALAAALIGVSALALAVAALIAPWRGHFKLSYYLRDGYTYSSILVWMLLLGVIPGVALLLAGRGRRYADLTVAGWGLLVLAPAPLLLHWTVVVPPTVALLLALVGSLLLAIPAYVYPGRALARTCMSCATVILALSLIGWTGYIGHWTNFDALNYQIASGVGALLLLAGAFAHVLARRVGTAAPKR
ncbi:serine/threonine-protein kinase [Mycobacterium camsae]|uniref:serine/threonine-protein kinase n=1 Tax=Mycobacterium gordonae TaxID=1778 RepID=UPI00197D21AB|nr:serine/threonine-protein kinase [Mycobacterium gordonae]